MQTTTTTQRRSSSVTLPSLQTFPSDAFSDARLHGYQGPTRSVRFPRATVTGGGAVAKSEDGMKCVVAGRESLRILRLSDPDDAAPIEQKAAVGYGGHRVELSKNLWDGSGLKIESASTDVAWCSANYSNKILTSARNGDLIMWDLDKPGSTKYERKTKNHIRAINKISCSSVVPNYCITGSADGDMRIWDLRDMSRSVMKIHHPTSVRSLVFSNSLLYRLQAVVGLDNGSIYRWDLQMGQRGQLDRLPVAHTGPILALDWCSTTVTSKGMDNVPTQTERSWIVSGGLDHTVKVWDLPGSNTSSHIVNKPTYVLHPSYPVRRVLWRPDYPCELAIVSNAEFGGGGADLMASPRLQNATTSFLSATAPTPESKDAGRTCGFVGETVEIWDVRRGWIAKWTVDTSVSDGGVTDAVFRDSHALLVQHVSGTFAQVDLRHSHRPIDAIPRVALSWNAVDGLGGALAFVADKRGKSEVPYDDVHPDRRALVADRRSRVKALGDKSRVPGLQNMGMFVQGSPSANIGLDAFVRLAKGYVLPDKSTQRKEVCALNAEVAIQAGNVHAAQAWVLLGSLLTDVVPESVIVSLSGPGKVEPLHPLIHSASAPGALPLTDSASMHVTGSASKPTSYRTLSADSAVPSLGSPHSPSQSRISHHHHHIPAPRSASVSGAASNEDRKHVRHRPDGQLPQPTKPPPNSRNLTPASSTSSSPRHVPVSLPPASALPLPPTTTMTPTTATATLTHRRPSILVSTASLMHGHARRPSVYSRGVSSVSAHSESPSVASVSDKSLRHVGEGALDDSDSSDGDGSESVAESQGQSHTNEVEHVDVPVVVPPARARSVSKARSMSTGPAHPSPLSRLAGQQQWVDEEEEDDDDKALVMDAEPDLRSGTSTVKRHVDEDEASPSPLSDDTDDERSDDSEGDVGRRVVTMARARKSSGTYARRFKNRSRSSTVASLAAGSGAFASPSPARSSPSRLRMGLGSPTPLHGVLERTGSQSSVQTVIAASVRELVNDGAVVDSGKEFGVEDEPTSWGEMGHERRVAVVEEERQIREAGWRALREALEEYADEGDVQMCAMLALVAPEELKLDLARTIQFVEAYVDMLVRYRLHTCAAYLRKYSRVEEVQKTTRLQTVIYTACRRCRKPVVAVRSRNPRIKATHAICATCKAAVVKCAICHLPVRTLLFQCSVCAHGGHQDCYRRYYMARPMVTLSMSSVRGRQTQREGEGEQEGEVEGWRGRERGQVRERRVAGHACAAGCGHVCWAAVGQWGEERE